MQNLTGRSAFAFSVGWRVALALVIVPSLLYSVLTADPTGAWSLIGLIPVLGLLRIRDIQFGSTGVAIGNRQHSWDSVESLWVFGPQTGLFRRIWPVSAAIRTETQYASTYMPARMWRDRLDSFVAVWREHDSEAEIVVENPRAFGFKTKSVKVYPKTAL